MSRNMDRIDRQLIEPLCRLSLEVAMRRLGFPSVASDCICPGGPARRSDDWNFQHEHKIMEYIERAVHKALAEDEEARALTPEEERVMFP